MPVLNRTEPARAAGVPTLFVTVPIRNEPTSSAGVPTFFVPVLIRAKTQKAVTIG